MAKKKRKLTREEEFDILKLVLDKFLWVGVFILLYGFYYVVESSLQFGLWIVGAGALILVLFSGILIKEYEIVD